jgi:DNA primase
MEKNSQLDLIRDRSDIIELVREYVPSLKKAGKSYKGRCPFHDEKTPSFNVDRQKGLFYCFGCGQGGDIFDFLMKIENLSFTESARKLAQKAGVDFSPMGTSSSEDKLRIEIKKALQFAAGYYHKILMESADGAKARQYLKSRNIGKKIAEKFKLGFAPGGFDVFCKTALKTGFGEDILIKAGLLIKKEKNIFDYFRERLMFPIANAADEIIGFGGRILSSGQPKYLNSPETRVFHKGRVLFGLNASASFIRKQNRALMLEGYTDVIACHKFSIDNAVAPLGTAVGFDHARLLKRYCKEVVMVFDADKAGINAAIKGANLLTEAGLYVKVAAMPDGLDPDEYLNKYGTGKMTEIINSAKDLANYHVDFLLKGKKLPLPARDKTIFADIIAETIFKQSDEIIKKVWMEQVSQKLGIDINALENRVDRSGRHNSFRDEKQEMTEQKIDAPLREITLLGCILKFPKHLNLCSKLTEEDFADGMVWKLFSQIRNLVQKNTDLKKLTSALLSEFPAEHNFITKINMEPIPDGFRPEQDIAHLVKLLKKAGMEREIKCIRQRQKHLKEQGEDISVLQKREMQLIMLLKSSVCSDQGV